VRASAPRASYDKALHDDGRLDCAGDASAGWLLVADIVAKGFWVSEEATLIQDQPAIRKVDSKICSLRFDCCAQAAPRRLLQQYRPDFISIGLERQLSGDELPYIAIEHDGRV
jgi:hypothetical protein